MNSLQIGHSRSPKYSSVTGAFGLPSTLPLCGMPASSDVTSVGRGVGRGCSRLTLVLELVAGGEQDRHDDHDDARDDDAQQREAFAAYRARLLGLLELLALRARLLAALLAREVGFPLPSGGVHEPYFYRFRISGG